MPRKATAVPPLVAVPHDLTLDAVRTIVDVAERAYSRRKELAREMDAALRVGDRDLVYQLAEALVRAELGELVG
jgi:hypothetical protein